MYCFNHTVPYGNNGCSCGDVTNSFKYIIDNGLDTEKDYPFISRVNFEISEIVYQMILCEL